MAGDEVYSNTSVPRSDHDRASGLSSQAVEKLETAIKLGQCPLYVLPTGGGKTIIASHIIERTVAQAKRVLVLTHRREILKQTSLKLSIDHGLI